MSFAHLFSNESIGVPDSNNISVQLPKQLINAYHPDTNEQIDVLEELRKCKADPKYFINTYAWTESDEGGHMRFKLWDFQNNTLDDFVSNRFNAILKSRQLGISWLSAAFIAWYSSFYPSKTILIISQKQEDAIIFLDHVKYIFAYLPEWLADALQVNNDKGQFKKFNEKSIAFQNNSIIRASATTSGAGRGQTISLLVLDEAAFIEHAEDMWKSVKPTVEKAGRAIILSTPNGAQGFFFNLYKEAEGELNDFKAIELGWEVRPDRDEAWAKRVISNEGDRYFMQEYACHFLGSGETLISFEQFSSIEKEWLCDPINKGIGNRRGLWKFKEPELGHRYIVSADVSLGVGGDPSGEGTDKSVTDFSAMHVLDIDTYEQVAEYKGKIHPKDFAILLHSVCQEYNNALFVVENNFGSADLILEEFENEWMYPNIYRQPPSKSNKPAIDITDMNARAGFHTTKQSRDKIIAHLQELLSTSSLIFRSTRTFAELQTFQYNAEKNKYEAGKGCHDDLILALAIGAYVINQYNLFGGVGSVLASSMLQAMRLGKNNYKTNEVLPWLSPQTNNEKSHTKFNTYFKEQTTGTDLKPFVAPVDKSDNSVNTKEQEEKKKKEEPQKSIFQYLR